MHDHDHPHAPIEVDERVSLDNRLLEQALRELLIEKGLFSAGELTAQIEKMEITTPTLGAGLVARFWKDPKFRQAALADGKAAAASQGIDVTFAPELVFLENTPTLHHVVVCTLCSCYPRAVLGPPPAWYKSFAYRSRVVIEPRKVLEEFGLNLPAEVEVRVVDSTAEVRYLVVPLPPPGYEGMEEAALAAEVSRDAMIGVALIGPRS